MQLFIDWLLQLYKWLARLFETEHYAYFPTRRPALNLYLVSHAAPKNQRKPEWVRNELIRLAALSRGSRRAVARLFNRLHDKRYGVTVSVSVSVSVSFTCDFLKRHALQVLRLRREMASR